MRKKGKIIGFQAVTRDITSRREAETKVKESEAQFRTIVESAPSLLLITDTGGKNIYVSPNSEKITGYSQEELLEKVVWWVHEDDEVRAREVFEKSYRLQLGGRDFEYRAVKKDGTLWYASTSWEPIGDDKDGFKGMVLQTLDITERRRAQETIAENERRFHAIFERAPTGMAIVDRDGKVLEVNGSLQVMLGYTKDEFQHTLFRDYMCADDRAAGMQPLDQWLKVNRGHLRAERCYLAKHGHVVWAQTCLSPIRDSAGQFQYFIAMLEDISERKRSEEMLLQSESRLRSLFEHSPVSLWEEDFSEVKGYIDALQRSGVKDVRKHLETHPKAVSGCARMVRVIDVNKASLVLFGAQEKSELLTGLDPILTDESYAAFREEIVAVADRRTSCETETIRQTLGGEKRNLSLEWIVVPL